MQMMVLMGVLRLDGKIGVKLRYDLKRFERLAVFLAESGSQSGLLSSMVIIFERLALILAESSSQPGQLSSMFIILADSPGESSLHSLQLN